MTRHPLVVSVHALDTGQGDGIMADAFVFAELDCRAACVATSALVPEALPLDVVSRQLERAAQLGTVGAVRVGFLRGAPQVEAVARFLRRAAPECGVLAVPLRTGDELLVDAETRIAMTRHLYPEAKVVVARVADLQALTGREVDDPSGLREAAHLLRDQGARAVVVSGFSARGRVIDLLVEGSDDVLLDTGRVQAPHVPGLAGSYAAALAAHLARGLPLRDAAESAQRYVGFRIARGR